MTDSNSGITTAQTNNSSLVAEIDQKLAAIDKRLSDIAGYKDVPPAIVEEKESLLKRKDILLATRTRLAGEESGSDVAPPSPPPPSWDKPPADDIASFDAGEKSKPENKDLIGSDYAVMDGEDNQTKRGEVFSFKGKEAEESQSVGELNLEDDALTNKLAKAETGQIFMKVNETIDLFNSVLKSNSGHPDKDYLAKVVQRLKEAVDNLERRSKETKMTESQLKQAILGRAAGYIRLVEAEFEFSGLLDREANASIKRIIDETG